MKLKLLILLLLFTSTLSAQKISFVLKDSSEIKLQTTSIDLLLEEYAKYETECYNDSTFVVKQGRDLEHPEHLVLITRWYWEHRDPTFIGFMEYLKGEQIKCVLQLKNQKIELN